jgi:hypothetical protein
MRKRLKAILLAAVTSVAGCSSYFIATYDPAIEGGATQLQQKVGDFLGELEQTSGTPEGEYENNVAHYEELRGDLQALREQASQQRGNTLTVQSLDLIGKNLDKLESMHRDGISTEEVAIVRELFDTQFRVLVKLETAKKRQGGLT